MLFHMITARTCFDIGHCAIKVKVTVGIFKVSAFITIQNVRFLVRKMKLKHAVGYENILDEFSVGHCGIKVKVTIHVTLWPKYIAINI